MLRNYYNIKLVVSALKSNAGRCAFRASPRRAASCRVTGTRAVGVWCVPRRGVVVVCCCSRALLASPCRHPCCRSVSWCCPAACALRPASRRRYAPGPRSAALTGVALPLCAWLCSALPLCACLRPAALHPASLCTGTRLRATALRLDLLASLCVRLALCPALLCRLGLLGSLLLCARLRCAALRPASSSFLARFRAAALRLGLAPLRPACSAPGFALPLCA